MQIPLLPRDWAVVDAAVWLAVAFLVACGHSGTPSRPTGQKAAEDRMSLQVDPAEVATRAFNPIWQVQFGTSGWDGCEDIAIGTEGDVVVLGSTQGALGGANHGSGDIFVSKMAGHDGSQLWTQQLGSAADDFVGGLAVDAQGDVFVAGHTRGAFADANAGETDVFVAKLSGSDGRVLWARQYGSAGVEYANSLALGPDGVVIVAGDLIGESLGLPLNGAVLVLSLAATDGELRWKRTFGGAAYDRGQSVAVAPDGSILVAGLSDGKGSLGEDAVAAVWRLAADGELSWAHRIDSGDSDFANAVAVDEQRVLVAGVTLGNIAGVNAGESDGFVRMLARTDGRTLWTRQLGTRRGEFVTSVAFDRAGHVLIAGGSEGALAAEPSGGFDAFVATLRDADGQPLWATQWGTAMAERVLAIAMGTAGEKLVCGSTAGALSGRSAGESDAFVAKLPSTRHR